MSELKTYKMVDEDYCDKALCVVPSDVYLKSEADEVIRRLKYKRCLCIISALYARAALFMINPEYHAWLAKWRDRWIAIANKFKEDK